MAEPDYRHTYTITIPIRVRQHHSGTPHSEEDTHEYEEEITFDLKASYHGEAMNQVRTMFEKLLALVTPV